MAFHLGSLGFLTSFRFRDFREKITGILEGEFNFLWGGGGGRGALEGPEAFV